MNQSKVIGFDKVSYFRCRCGGVGKADIAGLRRATADFFFVCDSTTKAFHYAGRFGLEEGMGLYIRDAMA